MKCSQCQFEWTPPPTVCPNCRTAGVTSASTSPDDHASETVNAADLPAQLGHKKIDDEIWWYHIFVPIIFPPFGLIWGIVNLARRRSHSGRMMIIVSGLLLVAGILMMPVSRVKQFRATVRQMHMFVTQGGQSGLYRSVYEKNEQGETALMLAAQRGDVTVLTKLINLGADVNARDKFGETVLMIVFSRRWTDSMQKTTALKTLGYLAPDVKEDGARMDIMHRETFLERQADCIRALIAAGADVNATLEETRVITVLFTAIGTHIGIRAKQKEGYTALLFATLLGNEEAVQALIAAGADVNVKMGGRSMTAHPQNCKTIRVRLH